ncbi:hypothetical protein RUND412_005881 [Rhizina undulata]
MTGPIAPNRTRIQTPRRESSPATIHPAEELKGLVPIGTALSLFTQNSLAGDPFAVFLISPQCSSHSLWSVGGLAEKKRPVDRDLEEVRVGPKEMTACRRSSRRD